jgi:hemin uptake protein HemP
MIAKAENLMADEPRERETSEHLPQPVENRPLIVHSDDLLQGRRELWIEHGEEMYRLRLTRAGKLYVTK